MFKMLYNEVLITAWIVFVFKFQRNNWLKIGDWQHVFFGCIDQFNLRLFEADPDSTSLCVLQNLTGSSYIVYVTCSYS